jgi:hypothetical protein
MWRRNFHGTVNTLADAVEADYLVLVVCQECLRRRQMHPYKLTSKYAKLHHAKFDVVLPGFYCSGCRQKVSVKIICTHRRSGEF